MKAQFISIAKKIGYIIAAFIIIAAILISISRLLTPVLDTHRTDIENWASQLLNEPVTIQQVRISWYQYQPQVSLNYVTVLNKETKNPILQINKVRIFFSIPQSIWQWKLVPSGIMISGTDINIYQNASGEFSVQGFPSLGGFNEEPYQSETKFTEVMGWLSTQPRLTLQKVDVRYSDAKAQKRYVTLENLSFVNSGERHSVVGKGILHQELPIELTAAVQWRGASVDMAKIKAKIYLYVSGLSLSQWAKGRVWNGWQVNEGIVSAKIWASWSNGQFRRIQTRIQSYDLDLYSTTDKSSHKINRFSGDMGWKRDGNNQIFAGDDIFIDLPTHLWPVTSFYLSLGTDANGKLTPAALNVGYLNISDVQAFLFSSEPVLAPDQQKTLSDLQLKGDIQNASMIFSGSWSDWSHISLNASIDRLKFLPWNGYPGVSNLSGLIKWDGSHGDLSLHSNQLVFRYDSLFVKPVTIEQLTGGVQWQRDKNNEWLLSIPALHLMNNDIAVNMNGSLTFSANASLVADLKASFAIQQASHIMRYLPARVLDPGLVTWLKEAFIKGEVQSGNVILRGPLNDIPFDKGNGQFLVTADIKNFDLRYAPDWPVLKEVNAKLIFSGRHMVVDLDHAKLQGIPVTNVRAVIPYLGADKPQILEVKTGDIQADFLQGMRFVRSSPLEKTIGKMFAGTEISGPITLSLGLTVPLAHPDDTAVDGNIALKNVEMNLLPWDLVLHKLTGQLHFTDKSTDASRITGEVFNKPLVLSLATVQKTKSTSVVRATVSTNLAMTDVEKWLKLPFSQVVSGAVDINTQIDFSLKTPIEVHLTSNLIGATINLSNNYAKKAGVARDFSADITIQEKQPLRIKMNYGDLLNAALILNKKNDKFELLGAVLRLGSGTASWPASSGIYITGNFEELDWDKIKSYTNQSGNTSFSGLSFRGVDINTKKLDIAGQHLADVRLQVTPSPSSWGIRITSSAVAGQIDLPVKFTRQSSINAQFQRLNLYTSSGSDSAMSSLDVKSLPSISFVANSVSYNNLPLGRVSFRTSPTNNGLTIQSLSIISPHVEMQATGAWLKSNKNDISHLQGNANSRNVSALLNSFGFDVHNFISSDGKLDFKLSWRDAPFKPTVKSLSGKASFNMGQGRIVEVGEASGAKMDLGRLLSIFSLQTIPRRLSLDFSDVFQKGYSFDYFKGDFNLQNGEAYTVNTHFDGPVARVGISGRIGLADKDADFTLSVTPYVTSSIPIAATLLTGNPLVGLAAFGVNTVLGSGVSNVTTYYYAVKGPWSNPTWGSVKVGKKQ